MNKDPRFVVPTTYPIKIRLLTIASHWLIAAMLGLIIGMMTASMFSTVFVHVWLKTHADIEAVAPEGTTYTFQNGEWVKEK